MKVESFSDFKVGDHIEVNLDSHSIRFHYPVTDINDRDEILTFSDGSIYRYRSQHDLIRYPSGGDEATDHHLITRNDNGYSWRCPFCDSGAATFVSAELAQQDLEGHIELYHNEEPAVTLTELFGMYVHMPDHTWDEPRPCLRCGVAVFIPEAHRRWHQKGQR